MTRQMATSVPFVSNPDNAAAFWLHNSLWVLLVEGHQTGGSYSLLEQWMRGGTHVPAHVHNFNDEWFYIIDGTLEMRVGDDVVHAEPGDSIWIPRGTVHSFDVTSDVCQVLNGYTPGGVEQSVRHLAEPADRRELPADTFPTPDERTMRLLFNNYWTCEAGAGWEQTNDDPRG